MFRILGTASRGIKMGNGWRDCSCGWGNPDWVMPFVGDVLVALGRFSLKMIVLLLWGHAQQMGDHLSGLFLRSLGKADLGESIIDR